MEGKIVVAASKRGDGRRVLSEVRFEWCLDRGAKRSAVSTFDRALRQRTLPKERSSQDAMKCIIRVLSEFD